MGLDVIKKLSTFRLIILPVGLMVVYPRYDVMNKVISFPSAIANKKQQPRYPFEDLNLEDLITECRKQEAWALKELFRRHLGLIVKTIKKTLKEGLPKKGSGKVEGLVSRDDVIHEIIVLIGEKMVKYFSSSKTDVHNANRFSGWLKKAAHDQSVEWIKQQNLQKDVINKDVAGMTSSLDRPLGQDRDFALIDTLEYDDEGAFSDETARALSQPLDEISRLEPLDRLLMKVILIFYDSLDDSDVKEIAKIRGTEVARVNAEIDGLMDNLIEKNEKGIAEQGKEQVIWYRLSSLERKLRELRKDSSADKKRISEIEAEIAEKTARLARLRKSHRAPIRPSNKQVAELLGVPECRAKALSQNIFRIRKKLKSSLGGDGA